LGIANLVRTSLNKETKRAVDYLKKALHTFIFSKKKHFQELPLKIQKAGELEMATCPNCGKELTTPKKKLTNSYFSLEAYTCDKCGQTFKKAI